MPHAVPPCVALLAVPCCQLLDVAGPFELFASAVRAGSPAPAYRVVLVAPEARRVTTEAGLGREAHGAPGSLCR